MKAKCAICKKVGHFAKTCRQKNADSVEATENVDLDIGELFLGAISDGSDAPWLENVIVNGKKVCFKIDSGADVTIISRSVFDEIRPIPVLSKANVQLTGVSRPIRHVGYFNASLQCREKKYDGRVYVIAQKCNLLSRELAQKMNLIRRIDSVNNSIGLMKVKPVNIMLRENAKPYSVMTPRRIPSR